jgi:hypothetical protein
MTQSSFYVSRIKAARLKVCAKAQNRSCSLDSGCAGLTRPPLTDDPKKFTS